MRAVVSRRGRVVAVLEYGRGPRYVPPAGGEVRALVERHASLRPDMALASEERLGGWLAWLGALGLERRGYLVQLEPGDGEDAPAR